MRPSLQLVVLIIASFSISACGILFGENGPFRDRSMDYKDAQTYPRMDVSQELERRVINDYHTIPEAKVKQGFEPTKDQPVPKPRVLIRVLSGEGVEIRRDDEKDFLWVDYPPEDVWPIVKNFFRQSGVELVHEDDAKGQLETEWLDELPKGENSYFNDIESRIRSFFGTTYSQKFRVDLVTDRDREVTGLLVSRTQYKLDDDDEDETDVPASKLDWQTQSEEEDLRSKVVQKLGEVILAEAPQLPGSGLVRDESAKPRIVMTQDGNGYPVLVMGMDFNRAWEAIGRALREAEIKVVDLNRSLATYYLDNRYTKGDDEPKMIELKLNQGERDVHIAVQKDDNTLMEKPISESILSRLKDKLG